MALFKGQVPVCSCSEVVAYGSALKESTEILLRVNMLKEFVLFNMYFSLH